MQTLVHEPLQFYETLARGMNSDQERPFVCNAPGCSQRFPTEDHLMIHRHKHEMTLKFPSIKNDNMLSGGLRQHPCGLICCYSPAGF
ncbi:hypothetical protein XENOCAPTIV_012270 [Xenoophorus captivus]|uniref:C2H2-type domain-containing protein n=1 Tax=Xenoophorus captivus TaxID=1517983 RepID=A0ABV0S0N9_9TELE